MTGGSEDKRGIWAEKRWPGESSQGLEGQIDLTVVIQLLSAFKIFQQDTA